MQAWDCRCGMRNPAQAAACKFCGTLQEFGTPVGAPPRRSQAPVILAVSLLIGGLLLGASVLVRTQAPRVPAPMPVVDAPRVETGEGLPPAVMMPHRPVVELPGAGQGVLMWEAQMLTAPCPACGARPEQITRRDAVIVGRCRNGHVLRAVGGGGWESSPP